jgi:hypothetical protein
MDGALADHLRQSISCFDAAGRYGAARPKAELICFLSVYHIEPVGTRPGTSEQDVHWAAIVVESVRTNGKPAQRHVAYLGDITDSAIEAVAQRAWFWDEVRRRLDRLADRMLPEDWKRTEGAVANKVPRVSEEPYAECFAAAGNCLVPNAYLHDAAPVHPRVDGRVCCPERVRAGLQQG